MPSNDLPDFLVEKNRRIGLDSKQVGQQPNGRSLQAQKIQATFFECFYLIYNELSCS